MFDFFADNMGTILLCIALGIVVLAILLKVVKDKKSGKKSCGCGCDGCPSAGICHKK